VYCRHECPYLLPQVILLESVLEVVEELDEAAPEFLRIARVRSS